MGLSSQCTHMCFGVCAAVFQWKTMAQELALTSGEAGAGEMIQLVAIGFFCPCQAGTEWAKQL